MDKRKSRLPFMNLQTFLALASLVSLSAQADIEWVAVQSAGNQPDPLTGYGAVSYEFRIGKFEVTNEQYAEFLNAVAKTDTFELWDPSMGTLPRCGISRSGLVGNYAYATKPNMANKPVNFISWFDTIRFCNWLHNGKNSGPQSSLTTEDGAYQITGSVVSVRKKTARFFLPTEDEWYKAAYFDPTSNGGSGGYWLYPTRSNSEPTTASSDENGNITNAGFNVVNWKSAASWNAQTGNVTAVGSAGLESSTYSGAFDMGGNVEEMNETKIGLNYGFRGGSWNLGGACSPLSTQRNITDGQPTAQYQSRGFRVASVSDTSDTDLDGIVDWTEVFVYLTNPFSSDTDGDGFQDSFEIAMGFDPTSASSAPDFAAVLLPAVELRFNAALGASYRIEQSSDLAIWSTIESQIVGTGAAISRFYSSDQHVRKFYRAVRN